MKYYFTYSIDDGGGWCEVVADSYDKAVEAFSEKHPPRVGTLIACAGIYPEDVFAKTIMADKGNFGKRCVERIGNELNENALNWSQRTVLTYLKEHGPSSGNDIQAGCHQQDWRKRISELRGMGFRIADEWETGENEYGIKRRYKRYWIKEAS